MTKNEKLKVEDEIQITESNLVNVWVVTTDGLGRSLGGIDSRQ